LLNFSSRSDSMSIGAEETIGNDEIQSSDEDDPRSSRGQGKRRRVESSSSDEESETEDLLTGDNADVENINNNQQQNPVPPDEEETRHPVVGTRGSPVYLCARKIATDKFECKICKTAFSAKNGSTTSISTHMSRFHPREPRVIEMVKIQNENRDEREKLRKERESKSNEEGTQMSMKSFVMGGKPVDLVKKKKIYGKLLDFLVSNNQSFSLVEDSFFRELMFEVEPGLVLMSRSTATRQLDERAELSRENLKKEILDDLSKAGHSAIAITSDHGTSRDNNRTRKNVLTLSRTTEDFSIKTDTLDVIICEESQTGANIRASVKASLVKWAGYDQEKMIVNWITDNEAKQVNARKPNYHNDIGLFIQFDGGCVDHLIELALTDALSLSFEMEESVKKAHDIVNYMKESSLSRVKLSEISENLGIKALSIVKGTMNRWFAKYFEMNRFLDLEQAIKEIQPDLPATLGTVSYEDWGNLRVYVHSLKPIVDAATMLESETSCTSSSVIPFILTVLDELGTLKASTRKEVHSRFYGELISQLKRRFPDGYKKVQPYNALTLIDPRHLDTYFNEEELDFAKDVIIHDKIYENERNEPQTPAAEIPAPLVQDKPVQSKVQSLRDKLLRQRFNEAQIGAAAERGNTFEEKIESELKQLLSLSSKGQMPDIDSNPSDWYREHEKEFPLLSQFWKAYGSIPATSSASERVFNVDGLVISLRRKSLDKERANNMILYHDYLVKRSKKERFQLCKKCPQPPDVGARYKISCNKHNT